MKYLVCRISVFLLAACALLLGQPGPGQPGPRPAPARDHGPRGGPMGKWWDNPEIAKRLGLTADQTKKMDDVFQQARLRLIDLHAALEKEEAILDPLMRAPQPDDSKVLPEIDKIAQARAELEKANARLLLAIRHVLTPEQWQMLEKDGMHPPGDGPSPRRVRPDGTPGGNPPPPPGQPRR